MDLIVRKIPQSDTIKVYPVSDVHLGSILHDKDGWQAFCRRVEREDAYLILGGDLINNNTRNAVGSPFTVMRMCHIACDVQITYANGAVVNTGFVTNLFDDDIIAMTAPGLGMAIQKANNAELGRKRNCENAYIAYPCIDRGASRQVFQTRDYLQGKPKRVHTYFKA